MKKFIWLCLFLATCSNINNAQQPVKKTPEQRLEEAWAELKRSKDTSKTLVMQIKQMANQKVVYRTKLVQRTDTVWRIDTCIQVFQAISEDKGLLIWRPPDTPTATKKGRKIFQWLIGVKNKNEKK